MRISSLILSSLTVLALVLPSSAFAGDGGASEKSVRELMDLTGSRSMIDAMIGQMDAAMKSGMQQALAGKPVTQEEQRIIDDMQKQMVAILQEALSWEAMQPMLVTVYSSSFTQAEVDGMVSFYRSPAGRAVIAKMPLVIQRSSTLAQEQMKPIIPKLQALQEDTMRKLRASGKK
jgi:hypothetical protein